MSEKISLDSSDMNDLKYLSLFPDKGKYQYDR